MPLAFSSASPLDHFPHLTRLLKVSDRLRDFVHECQEIGIFPWSERDEFALAAGIPFC
jgi:hypothetical protein